MQTGIPILAIARAVCNLALIPPVTSCECTCVLVADAGTEHVPSGAAKICTMQEISAFHRL